MSNADRIMKTHYVKLGAFYLGRGYDDARGGLSEDLLIAMPGRFMDDGRDPDLFDHFAAAALAKQPPVAFSWIGDRTV